MERFFYRIVLCLMMVGSSAFGQAVHYLDCMGGDDSHDSLTPESAWKTLAKSNDYILQPGDKLLLKRGTICTGMLWPKGSGINNRAITLGAYGTGELPQIIGTGNEAGIKLHNQQYWHIENLNVTGGSPFGIAIQGTMPSLSHFRITNVVVHDVTGEPKSKDSGLIVIAPVQKANTLFNDIVIDGATAYNTTQWAGIIINGANFSINGESARGDGITVRNSIVHDVGGDGILLARVKHGLIERNVAWNTGMQFTETIGTPDAIWEWMCEDCLVQYNEGFASDSPGVDGGVFDIDFGNINNIVQYNFAHDSQGYCVSIFGAEGTAGISRNSTIRRNLCLANGRSPRLAKRQGAIYLSTWSGGSLSGVHVDSNTIYWDPPINTAAIVNEAEIDQNTPRLFTNNLVLSRVSSLVHSNSNLDFSSNTYWTLGNAAPSWNIDKKTYASLSALQSATGQESGSVNLDPRLGKLLELGAVPDCQKSAVGTEDVYGTIPLAGACPKDAIAPAPPKLVPKRFLRTLPLSANGNSYAPSGWTLLAMVAPEGERDSDLSRSQLVVFQSMFQQFSTLGLHIDVAPNVHLSPESATNLSSDWNLGGIRLLTNSKPVSTREALGLASPIGFLLISPDGQVIRTWNGLTAAPEVELTLRTLLGAPPGMQEYKLSEQETTNSAKTR